MNSNREWKYILAVFFVICFTCVGFCEDITVEAEGSAEKKLDALNDAWNEAVRNAVGLVIRSTDKIVDDELTEKIATYSRGRVNSYKILKEEKIDGIWHVKISANIDKDILEETKTYGKKSVVNANQLAQIISASNQHKDAENLIDTYEPWNKPSDYLEYNTNTRVVDGKLWCFHCITVNDNYQKVFVTRLNKLLSEIASKTKKYSVNDKDTGLSDFLYFKDNMETILSSLTTDDLNSRYVGAEGYSERVYNMILRKDRFVTCSYHSISDFWRESDFKPWESNIVVLFTNYKEFVAFNIDRNSLIDRLVDKKFKKVYDIEFHCKMIIDGKENQWLTPKKTLNLFYTDYMCQCFVPFLFYRPYYYDWRQFEGFGPLFMVLQVIDLPQSGNIENIEFSYELQEK